MVTWSLLVAVTIGSAVAAGRWGESNPVTGSMLVFLAALPLVNAVLDWGSVGVTRLLLRRAALTRSKAQRVALGLLDAAIALGVLAGLTIAMVGAVRGLNTVHVLAGGYADLVDLAGILDRVAATPADPAVWWIYITLFSTLLPSVVHAIAAAAWVLTPTLLDRSIRRVHDALRRGEDIDNPLAAERLARRMTGLEIAKWGLPSLGVSTILAGLFVYSFGIIPTVGGWLLALARWTAGLPPAL